MNRSYVCDLAFLPVLLLRSKASTSVVESRPIWECVVKLRLHFTSNGPDIRQDYPLNLSILISGGKETNKDSPSNGE